MIPKRFIRVVPEYTSVETEWLWERVKHYHPRWDCMTLREPIDKAFFPLTGRHWDDCSPEQRLNLIRAEELFQRGGVAINIDVEVHRQLDPLIGTEGFIAYEDSQNILSSVMGFSAGHLALGYYIDLSFRRRDRNISDTLTTTEVFQNRTDVLLLPPGSFYPWHSTQTDLSDAACRAILKVQPWAFASRRIPRDP